MAKDMITGKMTRAIVTMLMLLCGGGEMWAALSEADIIINASPVSSGTVEADNSNIVQVANGWEVTLTVTPASGYYIKASDIVVEPLVGMDKANARRRAPRLANQIVGKMYEGSTEVSVTVSPTVATYKFTLPDNYDGAYVSATFSSSAGGEIWITGSTTSVTYNASGHYILTDDVNASVLANIISGSQTTAFAGTFEGEAKADGTLPIISGLTEPLFATTNGATINNVMLDGVNITTKSYTGTNVGAFVGEATGATRIYNCGILATGSTVETDKDGYTKITSCSSTISGSGNVGGIVGLLDGTSRVINCFSYADVSGGDYAGGIVGYNNIESTNPAIDLKTMVMNCMFYGEVSGSSIAPIYNGEIITNVDENKGVGNYNYFRLEASYVQPTGVTYNCALGAEDRYLQRFEFYRHLLNGHRELAGWWATGTFSKTEMAKWVLEPSQLGTSTPYPILKAQGKYPSVVNYDAENTPNTTERNKGRKLGELSVTIRMGSGGAVYGSPTGAAITTSSLKLNILDKDPDHFNFNYHKVQLPYYNDVGTKNYTGNRVVTGWKIVGISGGTPGSFTTGDDAPAYNFADRNCTNKDLYSESGRIFNQGAYWDVPEGVTSITIEPYWAKCAYLADPNADKVYNQAMTTGYDVPNVGGGAIYTNGNSYSIAGENQVVYTSIGNAISSSALYAGYTDDQRNNQSVYDYAVVLVGNYHHYYPNQDNLRIEASKSKPYTVTSIDLDGDNEPDYSYILRFDGRQETHPVRADFINIPGLGMAQKSTGGTGSYNFGILIPKGWYESTNTSLLRFTQFEYEHSSRSTTDAIIVQGGVMEQWVSNNQKGTSNKIPYIHVGGNVWFKEFHTGCHQDKKIATKHSPISVTGGDYDEFYLTGLYQSDITSKTDNAECYINGGRFGTVCGAAQEGIGKANGADNTGNITWLIHNADIKEFYAGALNAAKPATGNLSTTIIDSHVDIFCGGPKFGDMSANKTVVTNATGCTFGTFFGAGYGGNSYSRYAPSNQNNVTNINWNNWVRGQYTQSYNSTYGGVSTQIGYQFIPMSDNTTNVARLFVEFVKFSLATTHGVTSTLKNCTITGNFYGGGSLGKVDGDVTSTLTNCTVNGSVYGAGYSASLPTVEVMDIGFETEPLYYEDLGTYRKGVFPATTTYTWQHGNAISVDNNNHILYTPEDLTALGTVTGKAKLTIDGYTTLTDGKVMSVAESVYGGGEESSVGGDTEVIVNAGTIGVIPDGQTGGATYGNIYGGGKGKAQNEEGEDNDDYQLVIAGLVKGNTNVTINGGSILHNVYGGGAFGSVGTFTYADAAYHTANPTVAVGTILGHTSGGTANVTITGGTIGTTGKENGMVYGSSRGDVDAPESIQDRLAWVHDTHVIIGTTGQGTGAPQPQIKGSVYGSGENGHTYHDAEVTVHSGTIGIASGETITTNDNGTPDDPSDDTTYSGAAYPYRGNVYGGGCGTDKYYSNPSGVVNPNDGNGDTYNPLSGIVQGNATVNIDGGLVVHNVYGAGAMGSVGEITKTTENNTETISFASGGTTTIAISGGTVGVDGNGNGNVFGAARGDASTLQKDVALVKTTNVTISNGTVKGNVYGGGECGDVGTYTTDANDANIYPTGSGVSNVTISGGTVGVSGNGHGNVFGAGKGDAGTFKCMKAMVYKANVTVSNGTVHGNVYGGGEIGRVENDTKVDIGTQGEIEENTGKPDIKGSVFGAGKGLDTHGYSALVRGNPVVTVQGSAKVGGSVYGGGEIASVGKHSLVTDGNKDDHPELEVGMPFTLANTNVGVCTVTVKDKAEITGNVFGAGKGVKPEDITNPGRMKPDGDMEYYNASSYGVGFENAFHIYVQTLALVTETHVTVGGSATGTATKVLGSVYGGSESGFVQYHTNVDIQDNCEIGTSSVDGNVYGGGLGISGNDVAGRVGGNTNIDINGGTTHGSVFGGGAYGIVKGGVNIDVYDGVIDKDVYGGGALAHTNTAMWDDAKSQLLEYAEVKNLIVGSSSVTGYYTESGGTYTLINAPNAKAETGVTYYAVYKTAVNLLGGQLRDAYGGGLGSSSVAALVYGDTKVNLNGMAVDEYNANTTLYSSYVSAFDVNTPANGTDYYMVNADSKGCIVRRLFGCNNLNGTPKGNVNVNVYATQNKADSKSTIRDKFVKDEYSTNASILFNHLSDSIAIAKQLTPTAVTSEMEALTVDSEVNDLKAALSTLRTSLNGYISGSADKDIAQDAIDAIRYDVKAVYGGGNEAAYIPATSYDPTNAPTGSKTHVVIHGCHFTSIETVYGGGNAAPTPETNVDIYSSYEIENAFGGGNGKDRKESSGEVNPGANVGMYNNGTSDERYGTGNSTTWIYGGTVHEAYGGSNESGTIYGKVTIDVAGSNPDDCDLDVTKIVGAGKNADVNGDLVLIMGCKPETKIPLVYGGADNANVNGNVELTIISGNFGKVFGGNNEGGVIKGHIILNIEETGNCDTPITIDELYLGGNMAEYSMYGYYKDGTTSSGKPKYKSRTSATDSHLPTDHTGNDVAINAFTNYEPPVLNIVSCTRIGEVFGGGYGTGGDMYADPTVNINMIPGALANIIDRDGTPGPDDSTGKLLGAIGDVFGGGNAAAVYGNTTVNIGTAETIEMTTEPSHIGSEGTDYNYNSTTGKYKDVAVQGAYITGNVYGGGKLANVTGKTEVNICAKKVTTNNTTTWQSVPFTASQVTIGVAGEIDDDHGNVFGGGKGEASESGARAFYCEEAMVGEDNENRADRNNDPAYADYGTHVRIGNGTVNGNVYGGGEIGRVEFHTEVIVGLGGGTKGADKSPIIVGNVFGAGKGTNTRGYSGLVRGDSKVTVQGDAKIGHSVYGGGEMASVGKYEVVEGLPKTPLWGGKCTVTIQGYAEIGPDGMLMKNTTTGKPDDTGHVFGGGKGVLPYEGVSGDPYSIQPTGKVTYNSTYTPGSDGLGYEASYYKFIQSLGLASNSDVTIGGYAFVKGSVYGGSENGYLQADTHVTIAGGQIGEGLGQTAPYDDDAFIDPSVTPVTATTESNNTLATCATWDYDKVTTGKPYDKYATYLNGSDGEYYYDAEYNKSSAGGAHVATDGHTYYGNVFGGGSGVIPFAAGKWHRAAGSVAGSTRVDITGGHILSSVYGGNEHTDVGSYALGSDGEPTTNLMSGGTCTINISGGTVGVPRTKEQIENNPVIGNVFGAGKGDKRVLFNTWTNVGTTSVNISGDAKIYGSVFGGGEDGHVINNAVTNIGGTVTTGTASTGTTDHDYSKVVIGSTGISGADGNVFGGGRGSETALTAGVVGGNVTLTIDNGNILGSVYGGGRLASVGTNFVNPYQTDNSGNIVTDGSGNPVPHPDYGKMQSGNTHGHVTVNINGGYIGTPTATGVNGNIFGASKGSVNNFDLGLVKSTKITMTGGTAYASVYGGGELAQVVESHTTGDKTLGTEINISGGTIGISGLGQAIWGNVYGGGKGNTTNVEAGLVKTNTSVTISETDGTNNPTTIYHNIYGGGAYGSVGTFELSTDENKASYGVPYAGMPVNWTSNTGKAFISISGGSFGVNGAENGMVFGSSRGDVAAPGEIHDKLAWVYDTEVTIDGGQINGSVYGSGENGHTFNNTAVTIHNGTIGIASGSKITGSSGTEYEGAAYPYRGNVYGGGCGTDMYDSDNDGNEDMFNPLAGIVYGTTSVTMDGGTVVHNIYGAGAMGSVGKMTKDADNHLVISSGGTTTIDISGGTVGVSGTVEDGNVFGAARGDKDTEQTDCALVKTTSVTISQGTGKNTKIYGNVYGGGALGDVGTYWTVTDAGMDKGSNIYLGESGACVVTITGGTIGSEGNTATGHVFGAGKGDLGTYTCQKAMVDRTTVTVSNGTIYGNVYGGGEVGRVEHNSEVTIGDGAGVGTSETATSAPEIKGNVYGAGAGKETHGYSALVRGNSSVTIQANAKVRKNVYGGGEIATVGKYWVSKFSPHPSLGPPSGFPDGMPYMTRDGGLCTVNIQGHAQVGPDAMTDVSDDAGHVFGAGKGVEPHYVASGTGQSQRMNSDGDWEPFATNADYLQFLETLALASNTNVTVSANATVKGSVYGGSESGFVQDDTNVTIQNGEIGATGTYTYSNIGNVFGGGRGISGNATAGRVSGGVTLAINNGTAHGSVYGGGELGVVKGAVLVNMNGGTVDKDVYGGGALANTNTGNWDGSTLSVTYQEVSGLTAGTSSVVGYYTESGGTYTAATGTAVANTKYYRKTETIVNLLGGEIHGDAYGGGLGRLARNAAAAVYYTQDEADTYNTEHSLSSGDEGFVTTATIKTPATSAVTAVEATVYGDITVQLGDNTRDPVTNALAPVNATKFYITKYDGKGIVKTGRIFGCNNLNGSPQGNVTVDVYKTVPGSHTRTDITRDPTTNEITAEESPRTYEVAAVYGGGNLASFTATGKKTNVIIETCDVSIEAVYGGGNAAAVPQTDVLVKGAYEIESVFGGGNGRDKYTLDGGSTWNNNLGANVNGNANTLLTGGHVHEAYGGSNKKGTITGNVSIDVGTGGACTLEVGKVVGAGKNADVDGDLIVIMGCKPSAFVPLLYAGADDANVNGNVELTITSGHFGKVFGGNNDGGVIRGHIQLNIEETGTCETPIIIDELYLGGNKAAYSMYGYYNTKDTTDPDADDNFVPISKDNPDHHTADVGRYSVPYDAPVLNIISCTSIGQVFGGGLGETAVIYGDPVVNINMMPGSHANDIKRTNNTANAHDLGEIGEVFGGGNQAAVNGNTTVNIGTAKTVTVKSMTYNATTDTYTSGTGNVEGAYISGNVYGGGNLANVTGNTYVNVCAFVDDDDDTEDVTEYKSVAFSTSGYQGVAIGGNVYGGGKGLADTFECEKAMVGVENQGTGNTSVIIGNGTVGTLENGALTDGTGNVYGGGQLGRVENNTAVRIGVEHVADGERSAPVILGNVFAAGAGVETHGYSALVRGNSVLTVQGHANVRHNVYGGGEKATVGKYWVTGVPYPEGLNPPPPPVPEGMEDGLPYANRSGGDCTVTVRDNAVIGPENASDVSNSAGHVFGAGEGVGSEVYGSYAFTEGETSTMPWRMTTTPGEGKPLPTYYDDLGNGLIKEYYPTLTAYLKFLQTLGVVTDTHVTIDNQATVKGSVYGGSESGFVQEDTEVKIQNSSVIGTSGTTNYGNVFGGGRGLTTFAEAGKVKGNTSVAFNGGTAYGSVYGGGELGDIGTINKEDANKNYKWTDELGQLGENYTYNNTGVCNVTVAGGTVHHNVFGAGKGDDDTFECEKAMVYDANVTISGGTVGVLNNGVLATGTGNVYGGGEIGRVENDTEVTIGLEKTAEANTTYCEYDAEHETYNVVNVPAGQSVVGKFIRTGEEGSYTYTLVTASAPVIEGNVFGAGAGKETHGYSALVRHNSSVTVQGSAQVHHNVYGGGEKATVGRYWVNTPTLPAGAPTPPEGLEYGLPYANRSGGDCTVTVRGNAVVGPVDAANVSNSAGHVFGAGKGVGPDIYESYEYTAGQKSTMPWRINTDPGEGKRPAICDILSGGLIKEYYPTMADYLDFLVTLGIATDTYVTIDGQATVKGSVYGGSESGFVQRHTLVTVENGVIGTSGTTTYGNVFGGGRGLATFAEAGRVRGNTMVAVNGGNTYGSVYGGGELGDVGTINKEAPGKNYKWTDALGDLSSLGENYTYNNTGVCNVTIAGGTVHRNVFGAGKGEDDTFWCEKAMVYKTIVGISNGTVEKNVYGGGEIGRVESDAQVTIGLDTNADGSTTYYQKQTGEGGTVTYTTATVAKGSSVVGYYTRSGEEGSYVYTLIEESAPEVKGNVFGAGAGKETHGYSALVRNNSAVTVQGNAKVGQSVFGGGEIAAVGRYGLDGAGMPSTLKGGGECAVTIKGDAQIGPDGVSDDTGHVFGAGMGVDESTKTYSYTSGNTNTMPKRMMNYDPDVYKSGYENPYEVIGTTGYVWEYYPTREKYLKFLQTLALATDTKVSIEENATVNCSVYGGSESGFVQRDTEVKIKDNSTIGTATTAGNVFGGGRGVSGFAEAGRVRGNTTVAINNGTISGNVYGGGELGFVGYFDVSADGREYLWKPIKDKDGDDMTTGLCSVNITGGKVGPDGNTAKTRGNVYGAGRGEATTFKCEPALVRTVNVSISGGTVNRNVYGGGEVGRVDQHTVVNIGLPHVAVDGTTYYEYNDDTYTAAAVDEGESVVGYYTRSGEEGSYVYTLIEADEPTINGNVFGAGAGVETHGYSALVRGNTTVTVQGKAKVKNNVYGGGEIAAVGKYALDANNMPTSLVSDGLGICTVTIKDNANIGYGGAANDAGNVFGAGQGVTPHYYIDVDSYSTNAEKPKRMTIINGASDWEYFDNKADYFKFLQTLALATQTYVTIDGEAKVKGNVYGGSESGFVQHHVYVTVKDGDIGTTGSYGNVYGGGKGLEIFDEAGRVSGNTTLNINGGITHGSVYGGGEQGYVTDNVVVNMNNGLVEKDVYGGGALANTNTANKSKVTGLTVGESAVTGLYTDPDDPSTKITAADAKAEANTDYYKIVGTTVTLQGGTIKNDAYGGGLGRLEKDAVAADPANNVEAQAAVTAVEAKVYGDVLVTLNGDKPATSGGGDSGSGSGDSGSGSRRAPDMTNYYDCEVDGMIFGCNNLNGSPQSDVTVHVYNTVKKDGSGNVVAKPDKGSGDYELKAVYGGGNLAAYYPDDPTARASAQTHVIIDGCDLTSIKQVYGGGNAASAPATNVTVNGTYEIDEAFGGGNGKDDVSYDGTHYVTNPGANVGLRAYPDANNLPYDTKQNRDTNYGYGPGTAHITIYGGTVHSVYGGSNTRGNVRVESRTTLEDADNGCDFNVGEAYGGGNNAPQDGDAVLEIGCISGLDKAYGGASNADVNGNVILNITNGTYDQVFGGNDAGGAIRGSITVNIEETGCNPIIIGELYGGGCNAAYSVYGYDASGNVLTSGSNPVADPVVNVKSFTSIGNIYGGGYGRTATMVGSPEVNINVVKGKYSGQTSEDIFRDKEFVLEDDPNNTGKKRYSKEIDKNGTPHTVYVPAHDVNTIGAIYNVFGGGNAANVIGTPHVNVGTLTGEVISLVTKPIADSEGTDPTDEGWTSYELAKAEGIDIRGNVFGGGNAADVIGDTEVVIGKNNSVKTYSFTSYNAASDGTAWSSGLAQTTGATETINNEKYAEVVILTNGKYGEYVGKKFYVNPEGTGRLQLYDANKAATSLWVDIKTFELKTYSFTSYGAENGGSPYSTGGTATATGNFKTFSGQEYMQIVVLTNPGYDEWVGRTFYVPVNANTNGETRYQLYNADGTTENVWVTITKTE